MEKNTYKSKHKPPSRMRYEQNYPVWSVRMPKEWHMDVNTFLKDSNQSRREFMGKALGNQKRGYKRAYAKGCEEGYEEGYNKAKSDYEIWIICKICGEKCSIFPGSDVHKFIIEYLDKHSWEHPGCQEKKNSTSD